MNKMVSFTSTQETETQRCKLQTNMAIQWNHTKKVEFRFLKKTWVKDSINAYLYSFLSGMALKYLKQLKIHTKLIPSFLGSQSQPG